MNFVYHMDICFNFKEKNVYQIKDKKFIRTFIQDKMFIRMKYLNLDIN